MLLKSIGMTAIAHLSQAYGIGGESGETWEELIGRIQVYRSQGMIGADLAGF